MKIIGEKAELCQKIESVTLYKETCNVTKAAKVTLYTNFSQLWFILLLSMFF